MTADTLLTAALDDLRRLIGDCERIVLRGKDAFFDTEDRTQQLAAKAIVVDLGAAAVRLPREFRAQHPDVAWDELRVMPDYLAREDADIDFVIVWNTLVRDFPRLRDQLGL